MDVFERFCAERLHEERGAILDDWLSDRLREAEEPGTRESLLEVLSHVAEFLEMDDERTLTSRTEVVDRLTDYVSRRYASGADARDLTVEFELLARVLHGAILRWISRFDGQAAPEAIVRVAGRLNRAPLLLAEIAVGTYLDIVTRRRTVDGERIRAFANNLAHELKSPINAAETAALVLADAELVTDATERRRFAGAIQRSLERVRAVIDDLRALALADSEAGLHQRRIPIALVLANVLVEARESLERCGVEVEVLEPVPHLVVDASRVELILINLLDNAIKYSDPSRPLRRVSIAFQPDRYEQELWWVSVSDNGLGIAAEHRARVFDPFFRAHPARAEGSGLGLAIVREAAEQIGSRLLVESEPGVGSTFRFGLRASDHQDDEISR